MTVQVQKVQKPWEARGISRSAYFAKKKMGTLDLVKQSKSPEVQSKASKSLKILEVAVQSDSKESKKSKEDKPWLIKPGQVLNPAGRPKGSRNKLTDKYVGAMYEAFEKSGKKAIEEILERSPEKFIAEIGRLVPQQIEHGEAGAFSDIESDDLDILLEKANSRIASLQVVGHA